MKESFGFHEYVDLNTGVLLTSTLFTKVVDPANCKDQKTAGGTFDMFDAKLGNCVFYLGAQACTCICMVCAWCVHSVCMVCAWCVHGACMVCAWYVHGVCMMCA